MKQKHKIVLMAVLLAMTCAYPFNAIGADASEELPKPQSRVKRPSSVLDQSSAHKATDPQSQDNFLEASALPPKKQKLQNAFERLRYSKWNPKALREYKIDIIDREDNSIMLATERAEGKKEGKEEGREEERQKNLAEKKKMAIKLLAKGMDVEEVSEITGLSVQELQSPQV